MKKTTKIIASVAVAVVLVAAIVTISLFKDSESGTPTTSFSVPSTTLLVQPQLTETESWFDWDAYINSLNLSTESESSTINPSDPTALVPSTGPNVVISIVYPSDYVPQTLPNSTTTTTEPTTKKPDVQMVDYKYTIKGDSVTITSYFGSDMTPNIPAQINGLPVSKIGYNCFKGSQITSVYIPSTVHTIDTAAFSSCLKLKNVYFMSDSSSVDIGDSAFQNCKALTTIKLPQETLSIGENAFSGCSSLTKLSIPESVTAIGGNAFSGTNEAFTIYCKQNSEGHAAALRNDLKFELE
ncbi:MAG: leucine-rich repeat domain-containing protein [Ruminococcaceae bacterium]|nr:leucine-rich repeat domain-containing protein [Oscillospiraceae bacterium]